MNKKTMLLKNYIASTLILEQNSTECLTSGAQFHQEITNDNVSISVDMPFDLELDEEEAIKLETLLHNAVEIVLRPYFKSDKNNFRKEISNVRNSGREVISFDFHSTLVDVINKENVTPRYQMIEKLIDYKNKGSYIVIYTAAPESDRDLVSSQLNQFNIPYDRLEMGKPEFDKMYDNRYIGPEDDWV